MLSFLVNSTPILDGKGAVRGAMASFEDVTALDYKTAQLEHIVAQLESSQADVQLQNAQLTILATRDPLTGLVNRRSLFEQFEVAFDHARSSGTPLSCIMCDIDHFKSVNDDFGHPMGDAVLKEVSHALAESVREADVIGRFGGEEFCVVLPTAGSDRALRVVERMQARVAAETDEPRVRGDGGSVHAGAALPGIR